MRAWEANIRRVTPYVPGEQPGTDKVIKLNTNENPYPPSPEVARALGEMTAGAMRKYPAVDARPLVNEIASFYHRKPDQVFVGVGSDDVLAMCFLTFFHSDRPVLFPDITYSFYDVWAELFRIPYEQIALDENFQIRPEDYQRENGGVIFPNPNAPTGELLKKEAVEEIIRNNQDVVVIVDEAYIDFGGESVLDLTDVYDNLLVVQTASKSRSLAGMRIGWAMGNEKLIAYLNDVKYSFNSYTMSEAALTLGAAAIRDRAYFEETSAKIIKTREEAKKRLAALGFIAGDSKANFLFVTHRDCPAKEIFEALKKAGIYVRYWDKPRIGNYLRITVGTDEEMEKLYTFLAKFFRTRRDGEAVR